MIIRWICRKCNKKWIYPIEKCVYCYGRIEKQIGKKLKVMGNTKVFVPSVMHPIVPYNIVILQDEHGNQMPKKTMKDCSIGDSFEWQKAKTKNAVAIVKIKYDVYEAVKEALHLIGKPDVNENSKVLIKPNIMTSAYPYLAMTTNPKTVEAIIQYLVERKVKPENITIAEQCLFGKIEEALDKSGFGELVKKYNVRFVDIAKGNFEEREANGLKLEISKEIFNHDLIINIPILKTHMQLVVSGALENMARILSPEDVSTLAEESPEKILNTIITLHKLIPKYLTLGDGTIGMQGNGPLQYGEPAFLNLVMASYDPVAHDKYFQELGLLRKSHLVELTGQSGIGEADLENIENVGDELKACQRELKQPVGSALIKAK